MRHVMLDTETLGLAVDSIIVSIGAVVFTENGVEGTGYWPVSLHQPNRTVSSSTVAWWMQQSDEARKVFTEESVPLSQALKELASSFDRDTWVWSNGADFDIPLLKNAYEELGLKAPWNYKNTRCFRTVRALYPEVVVSENGVKHNALADAAWQANYLYSLSQQHGLKL